MMRLSKPFIGGLLLFAINSLNSIFLPTASAARAVMEGIAATNTTIFVDTTNTRVGISTGSPVSKLQVVNGDIRVSTTTGQASRGIIFQDGTTQTTAASGTGVAGSDTQVQYNNSGVVAGAANLIYSGNNTQLGAGTTRSSFTSTGNLQLVSGGTITANGTITISTAASASTASQNIFIDNSGLVNFGTPISSNFANTISVNFTRNSLGQCDSTGTITLPMGGGNIQVGFSGAAYSGTLAAFFQIAILVDGAFIHGASTTIGNIGQGEDVANTSENMSFALPPITGLSSGAHNICFSPAINAGTGQWGGLNANRFWALRLP